MVGQGPRIAIWNFLKMTHLSLYEVWQAHGVEGIYGRLWSMSTTNSVYLGTLISIQVAMGTIPPNLTVCRPKPDCQNTKLNFDI